MPNISGPDGKVISFPDGTPDADIAAAFAGASAPNIGVGGHDLSTVAGMQPRMRARDPGAPLPSALRQVDVPLNIQQAQTEGNASLPMEIQNKLVDAAKAIPRGAVTGVAAAIGAPDPFTGEDARDELQRGIESAVAPAASHGGNFFTRNIRGGVAGLDAAVGGDPTAGGANWDQGNYGKAVADYLAVPLAFHFGVKALPSLPGMSSEQPVPPPSQASQMAFKVAAPDVGGTPRFTAPGIVPALTERLRQAARDSGITDANVKSMFPSGNREITRPSTWFKPFSGDVNTTPVQQGLANRNALWDKFTQGYEDQYQGMLDPFKSVKTDAAARAAADLRGSVTSAEATASPALATATDAIANRVEEAGKGGNLGQLDTLRKEFNKAADRVYQQRDAGVSDSDLQVADANRRAADAIRSATYDDLAQFSSGSPAASGDVFDAQRNQIQQLQQEHGAAIEAADAAKKQGLKVQPDENTLRQKGRVAYTLTGGSTSAARTTSMRPQYMLQRAFNASPQAEQNILMRKSLSNLGEGGANPSTTLAPREAPQLPYPAVEIPTELQQAIPTEGPTAQAATPASFSHTPVLQLPPISSVPIEGAGAPDVTGGVFPARPSPPMFVTDYVGSGARGEPAAMPGTARAQIEVHTAADAARALTGYEKYIDTPEFKKLDVARQKQIVDTMDSLHAFAQQGQTGAVGRVSVRQFAEPTPSSAGDLRGQNAGTLSVKTPADAQSMLSRLHNIDTSNMDAATKAKLDDTIAALTRLANIRENPVTLPQLTTHPAVAATRTVKTLPAKALPKLARAAVVTGQAAQRGQDANQ